MPTIHACQKYCWGTIAAALLSAVSGCNRSELQCRVNEMEARLNTASEVKAPPAPAASAAPIRRTLESSESVAHWIDRRLLETLAEGVRAFTATKNDKGEIVLHGDSDVAPAGAELLKRFGFKQIANKGNKLGWEHHVAAKDFPNFERKVLSTSPKELEAAVSFYEKAGQPGTNLKYTGQPLDIAMAPDVGGAKLFIEVSTSDKTDGKKFFSRGGSFYAGADGKILLNHGLIPSGIQQTLPADAAQLEIESDGRVNATLASGAKAELGRLKIVRLSNAKEADGQAHLFEGANPEVVNGAKQNSIWPGHLETSDMAELSVSDAVISCRQVLFALKEGLAAGDNLLAPAPDSEALPLVVYAALAKSAEHLKALRVPVEKTSDRTTIGTGADEDDVTQALITVLQGLRKRMAVNEENLRNAGKTRDADGRLNAYRRKTVDLGSNGVLVEGLDKSPLPKSYKQGDPDAGPDGFVVLSNVNKAVEMAEYKAVIEEYKLLRIALERLSPRQVFPEPPVPHE